MSHLPEKLQIVLHSVAICDCKLWCCFEKQNHISEWLHMSLSYQLQQALKFVIESPQCKQKAFAFYSLVLNFEWEN